MSKKLLICFLFSLLIVKVSHAQPDEKNWPKGTSPHETGLRVAERFIASPHGIYNAPGTKPHIPYFEVCTWYGALTFAQLTKNKSLRNN
ncbi:MAG: hypothetical protein WDO71_00565 [Bacteroidota bacterium]